MDTEPIHWEEEGCESELEAESEERRSSDSAENVDQKPSVPTNAPTLEVKESEL